MLFFFRTFAAAKAANDAKNRLQGKKALCFCGCKITTFF